jgi:GTP-binding protein
MSRSFVDYAKVFVKAGDGGDGCVAFRREKYVPRGGPSGGDGGHGGSVWLVTEASMMTLLDLKLRPALRADRGRHGEGAQKTGRSGRDLEVSVPLGTVVSDEDGHSLADLVQPGQRFLAAQGGRGGLGNQHFATPTNQAPRKATPGRPGPARTLVLELKLIAQAGLIGLPNAGKSTLLAALTAATPKIASYPFTTLHPNLGVMEADATRRVTLADIPGLIEGAMHGAGLGARFLRHIERTALLVHLVAPPDDPAIAARPEAAAEQIAYAHALVRRELESYSAALAAKPELIVLTKIDLLEPAARERLLAVLHQQGLDPLPISAQSGEGLAAFKKALVERLDALGLIAEDPARPLPPLTDKASALADADPDAQANVKEKPSA